MGRPTPKRHLRNTHNRTKHRKRPAPPTVKLKAVPAKTGQKARQKAGSVNSPPGYPQLGNQSFALGTQIAQRLGTGPVTGTGAPARDLVSSLVFGGTAKQRSAAYRAVHPAMDEQVPTKSVVRMSQGIEQTLPNMPASQRRRVNGLLTQLSAMRAPTQVIGHVMKGTGAHLQHPTAVGTAVWSTDRSQGSHNFHDRTRHAFAVRAGQAAAAQPNSPPERITHAMCAAGGQYTRNAMWAPIDARNVQPAQPLDQPTRDNFHLLRESQKLRDRDEHGMPMARGTQPRDADWIGPDGDPARPGSPWRVEHGESEADHIKKLQAYQKRLDAKNNKTPRARL